ncbi:MULTISPECIES: hypothetical protein [unclassified Sphingomonas]|uniref:hypothetical protein n=1 Tax=Sphingomonas TaxID=13687 RepID=UPI00095D04E7|nr:MULTISPECIES: hypothetical protein [unclassified Sphingomonas]MBN8810485.1 hypothetical protein [Sphingomonas sp.]OJY51008.1 MAG: hypothetical protein BGP17_21810 [Sphingomonas sp. 67-41]
MLRTMLFLAVPLALAPLPALADMTARYGVDGKELVVEADEGGNSRVELAGKFAIVRRDGADYVVLYGKTGPKVFELQAMAALFKAMLPKAAEAAKEKVEFGLEAGPASATVAGRTGSVWLMRMLAGPGKDRKRHIEIVTSADPQLAPIGRIVARAADLALDFMAGFIPESTQFGTTARGLLAKGTLLRIQPVDSGVPGKIVFELRSVDTAAIDPKHFELPGPVASAEEVFGAMDGLAPPGGGGKIENLP